MMYLPPTSRFSHLRSLPEGENIGKAINEAIRAMEADNEVITMNHLNHGGLHFV